MLILTRIAKTVAVFVLAMDFFVFGTLAETATSYSCQYAADLEQKQMLLESIKEDASVTDTGLRGNIDSGKAFESEKTSGLKVENIDLARVMPPTEKINVAFIGMSGTLSPKSGRGRFSEEKDSIRN